jgi:hypothetical protein
MAEDSGAFKTNPVNSRPIEAFVMIPEPPFPSASAVLAGLAAADI